MCIRDRSVGIITVPVNPDIGVKIRSVSFIVTDPLTGREVLSRLIMRGSLSGSISLFNTSTIIGVSEMTLTVSFIAIGKLLSLATSINTNAVSHKLGIPSSQII